MGVHADEKANPGAAAKWRVARQICIQAAYAECSATFTPMLAVQFRIVQQIRKAVLSNRYRSKGSLREHSSRGCLQLEISEYRIYIELRRAFIVAGSIWTEKSTSAQTRCDYVYEVIRSHLRTTRQSVHRKIAVLPRLAQNLVPLQETASPDGRQKRAHQQIEINAS